MPEEQQPLRDFRNPLYSDKCRDVIERLPCNRSVPRVAMDAAFGKIESVDGAGLIERNRTFTYYLQNGVEVRYDEKGEEKLRGQTLSGL